MFKLITKYNKKRGFGFIELSIVLLITALFLTGVVGGRALYSKGQIISIIEEINSLKKGIKIFQESYEATPGNANYFTCIDIDKFNGNAADLDALCSNANQVYTAGISYPNAVANVNTFSIEFATGSTSDSLAGNFGKKGDGLIKTIFESATAIQHLYYAGYISSPRYNKLTIGYNPTVPDPENGILTGVTAGSGAFIDMEISALYPNLSAKKDVFLVPGALSSIVQSANGRNLIIGALLGTADPAWVDANFIYLSGRKIFIPALSGKECERLDKKMDDGKPMSGGFKIPRPFALLAPNNDPVITAVNGTTAYAPNRCFGQVQAFNNVYYYPTSVYNEYLFNNDNKNGETIACNPAILVP